MWKLIISTFTFCFLQLDHGFMLANRSQWKRLMLRENNSLQELVRSSYEGNLEECKEDDKIIGNLRIVWLPLSVFPSSFRHRLGGWGASSPATGFYFVFSTLKYIQCYTARLMRNCWTALFPGVFHLNCKVFPIAII